MPERHQESGEVPATRPAAKAGARPARAVRPEYRAPELTAAVLLDVDGRAVVSDVDAVGAPAGKTLADLFAWIASGPGLGVAAVHKDGRRHNGQVVLSAALCKALKLPAKVPTVDAKRAELLAKLKAAADAAGCDMGDTIGPRLAVRPRKAPGARRRAEAVTLVVLPWLEQGAGAGQAAGYWLGVLADGADGAKLARRLRAVAADLGVPFTGTASVTARTLLESLHPREEWSAAHDGTRVAKAGVLPDGDLCVPPAAGRMHPLTVAEVKAGRPVCREDDLIRWQRPLTPEESALPWAVELDVSTAHLAVTGTLAVPIGPLVHTPNPRFDKRAGGMWLCDFTGLSLAAPAVPEHLRARAEELLPHPATTDGKAPTGPDWYATQTVEYMVSAYGFDPSTITEAYVSTQSGAALKEFTGALRGAYKGRLAGLGVMDDMAPAEYLAAYAGRESLAARDADAADALALVAVYKEIYRAHTGMWSQNPVGDSPEALERWLKDVAASWHYRPEIRFTILAASRIAMHRRLLKTFALTGRAPFAVHVDGVLYAAATPDPLELVVLDAAGKQVPGTVRLGSAPGSCKHDASIPMGDVVAALAEGTPLQGALGLAPQYDTEGNRTEEESNRG